MTALDLSLIQGALEIARESRTKAQKKYVALRKSTRFDTKDEDPAPVDGEEVEITNVRPLKPAEAE